MTAPNAAAAQQVPPHNIEAEMAVLGAAMLGDLGAIDTAASIIGRGDFYRDAHAHLWEAILTLHGKREPVDIVTLKDELQRRGILEQIGGVSYLMQLADVEFTTANVGHYARIVRDRSVGRSIIEVGREAAGRAYANEESGALLSDMEARMLALRSRNEGAGLWVPARVAAQESLDSLNERFHAGGAIRGIRTGWRLFDAITLGLRDGYFYVLAARPGMGKTQAALQICANAVLRESKRVGVFSLEMDRVSLIDRIACSEGMVDFRRHQSGQVSDEEFSRVADTVSRLWDAPLFIDDSAAVSVTDVQIRSRRLKAEHGLDLLVIDYLQLLKSDAAASKNETRAQEVGEMSRVLKNVARELQIPVIALAQLNRSVERREDKRPMLSDLAESGGIEANVDAAIFLYRPDYYDNSAPSTEPQTAELIVQKHRNGQRGTVHLQFLPWCVRFENAPVTPAPKEIF